MPFVPSSSSPGFSFPSSQSLCFSPTSFFGSVLSTSCVLSILIQVYIPAFPYNWENLFARSCELCFPCFPVYLCFMQKSKDNPKLSGKNNCAPIKPAFPLYRQKPIFMVSCPKLAFPWKKPGANCVFPWISWSQKPQTCIPWEKPIRTWVRIVFSHGFMGSEAPNLHLFGKNLYSHLGANCV